MSCPQAARWLLKQGNMVRANTRARAMARIWASGERLTRSDGPADSGEGSNRGGKSGGRASHNPDPGRGNFMRVAAGALLVAATVAFPGCSTHSQKLALTGSSHSWSAPSGGGCALQRGSSPETLLVGAVVLDNHQLVRRGVLLSGGQIAAIDDADLLHRRYSEASLIVCEHAFISPGLINPHEHPAFSFQFPDPNMAPVYVHRDEWRQGLNGKPKLAYEDTKDPAVLAWIEIRHLVHGVTTIAGSGGIAGIVKNASSANPASATYVYMVDMQTFPFGLDVDKNFGDMPCDSDPLKLGTPKLSIGTPTTAAYVPHVGEGTNCAAKLELDDYLSYVTSNPGRKYSLIHGIALTETNVQTLRANKISVIWSPRSNLALYGKTLDASWLLDAGVSVALGTDWSLSGSFNILDEMTCAKEVSQAKGTRPINGRELWRMVTIEAAAALGIESATGSIAKGKAADLVLVNDPDGVGISRLGSIDQSDIIAVLVDGVLMAGDVKRFGNRPTERCPNEVDGKFVCVDFSKYSFSFDDMKVRNAKNVDLIDTRREAGCRF